MVCVPINRHSWMDLKLLFEVFFRIMWIEK